MLKPILNYYKTIYPLHMPGHKLGRISPINIRNLYNIDVTEVPGLDHLYNPKGIIKEAIDRVKEIYGTKETFFLVNGSSCGILSSISACCNLGDKIIISRNSHKSVYNSIYINNLDPIYVYPDIIKQHTIFGGMEPSLIEEAINKNKDIKCVIITSPTYEGFVSNIKKIADICHKKNIILIVDEAHGAHFLYNEYFPNSALKCGADIVIQSLHKTLPAFTSSALLHVNSSRIDVEKLKFNLSIYQTSSPSYIILTGIISCIDFINKNSILFDKHVDKIINFRKNVDELNLIGLIDESIKNKYSIFDVDLTKLVFIGKNKKLNGKKFEEVLRKNFNIQLEMSSLNSAIGITTIADSSKIYKKLFNALRKIDNQKNLEINNFEIIIEKKHITRAMNLYEALSKKWSYLNFNESEGKIIADYINLYPPGIPILVPGEYITREIINNINNYIKLGFTVEGIYNGNVKVIDS